MNHVHAALLVMRLFFGLGLAYHGIRKVVGPGGLNGTGKWFESIGMKWPALQARLAAGTEIGGGLLFAVGLLTPFAAASMVGVMIVAGWVAHRKNGFLITNSGWEHTAAIAVAAWGVGAIGGGRFSLDNAFGISFDGWSGALIAGLVGIGGGIGQLAACYRPATAAPAKV